ncbi:MAG: radical SAM family heme chaperone HemW [Eubacteriales bacterium]|nr:radical SAM family heme chaperone HemW [Eubacteriales bacterium]MDD4105690.1 radical SAM family heme chaperone HemW [Eubacteriales bacterium]MDD4711088.1 radical SAM family heme chaperone HemW [Eubacteriales bacterium]NLO15115.1 radical SAM family heme chaperone HemW [Clostridiales bacterium]
MINRLGLYVHVPFCAKKCAYCDFPSWPGKLALQAQYVSRVREEILRRGREAGRPPADTVFFGGGTPSLIRPELLGLLLKSLYEAFDIAPDAEITCEANPGMLSHAFLDAAVSGGVNRLSIGAQSSHEQELRVLGRQHDWEKVQQAVHDATSAGISNVNIDLMFGLPGQSRASWEETLLRTSDLPLEHIACYGLIIEDNTPLKARFDRGELQLPEPEEEREMYNLAISLLKSRGIHQYEISNFARPGSECRHNIGCWTRVPYLGFGCAAHSLRDTGTRLQNPDSLDDYLANSEAGQIHLDKQEQMFEQMMLGLRMTTGVSDEAFQKAFDIGIARAFGKRLHPSLSRGLTRWTDDGFFCLTDKGMDLMNTVLLDLMP